MIAIVCPRCERKGNVPESKVNLKLHCPKCNVGFYVDASNRVHVGEPPAPASGRGGTAVKKEKAKTKDPAKDLKIERIDHQLADQWRDLPRSTQIAIPVFAVGAVVLLFYLFGGTPLPEGTDRRAQMVGTAVLNNDSSGLARLCASGTASDATRWMDQVHSKLVVAHGDVSNLLVIAIGSANAAAEEAQFTISYLPPDSSLAIGSSRKTDAQGKLAGPTDDDRAVTYWTRQGGQWWLNGTKTLQLKQQAPTGPAAPADTPPNP